MKKLKPKLTPDQTPWSPKAVLFDFDGVIVDSKATHQEAWKSAALEMWGNDPGVYPTELSGQSPFNIARYFSTLNKDEAGTEKYMNLKRDHLGKQEQPAPLLPGVNALLTHLDKYTIPFGIASNAPQSFVIRTAQMHNLPVKHMFGYENYRHPKPNPEPYLLLAKTLQISPVDYSKCIIFEDSKTGLQAAAATGMTVVGLKTAYDETILRAAGADYVVQDLEEALRRFFL